MSSKTTIPGTVEAWESGQLGTDKKHAKRAPAELEQAVEEAIAMQPISIRLPRSIVKVYKDLASIHGVGYQPLMRDALCRFAEAEMKRLLAGAAQSQSASDRARAAEEEEPHRRKAA
jgi:hypothetical protein